MLKFISFFLILFFLASCSSFQARDEETARLHLQLGTSQLSNENYPQALSELLIAESLDPENPVILNNLGLAYFFRERPDIAEIQLRKALELKPEYSDARNNLSRVLIERSKYEQAIAEAQKVIKDLTYPHPEKPLINLGMAQFKLGHFEAARGTFRKAIDIQRDNCLALSFYGRSLYEMKDYERASEALDRAAGFCLRSQFDEPQYYSALSYYQLGHKKRAEARLEELLKMYPQGSYLDKSKSMLETIRR